MIDIPKKIWLWLGSDELSSSIESINKLIGLAGRDETIIANLIASLVVKKIDWSQFLTELNNSLTPLVGEEKAKQAIESVKAILTPVKQDLADFGIVIDAAQIGPELPIEASAPTLNAVPETNSAPIPEKTPRSVPPPPPTLPAQIIKPEFKNAPLVIHEAEAPAAAGEKRKESAAQTEYFYHPSFDSAPKFQAPPPIAKIETDYEVAPAVQPKPSAAKSGEPPTRIVHYSELRTPVNPFGQAPSDSAPIHPANIVNLKPENNESGASNIHPNNVVNLKDLPVEE